MISAFVLGWNTFCFIFRYYTRLTALSRRYQSHGIVRTRNELGRTTNRSADDTIIPTLALITSIIPCGAWIIVLSFMEANAICWFNTICAIKHCFTGALASGYTRYCKCLSARVVHVLTGLITDWFTRSVHHVGRALQRSNCNNACILWLDVC